MLNGSLKLSDFKKKNINLVELQKNSGYATGTIYLQIIELEIKRLLI